MVVIFNSQNSHLLTLSLPTVEVFQIKQPKSSSCRFSFSDERNANTKATEYATFGFYFSLLSHRLLVLKDYSALVGVFQSCLNISLHTNYI